MEEETGKALADHALRLEAVAKGRKNLGQEMPVAIYRLFEENIKAALEDACGAQTCIEVFRQAGRRAGESLFQSYLKDCASLRDLLGAAQRLFAEMRVGILRVEQLEEGGRTLLTMSEDLDCSGLPVLGETVCHYDEGLLEGIFQNFTGKSYQAVEIDCWATGARVCRFEVKPKEL